MDVELHAANIDYSDVQIDDIHITNSLISLEKYKGCQIKIQ